MSKKREITKLGQEYGRPDLERLGLFSEMPYMRYKNYVSRYQRHPGGKRNILAEGPKTKTGWQDCYFDKKFKRIFEGEAIDKTKKKRIDIGRGGMPFLPAGPSKIHATLGDYYGTFSGKIEAFGTGLKRQQLKGKLTKQPPNMKIGATKMGDCGYADICLSKYPEHLTDPYQPKKKMKGDNLKSSGKHPMIPTHFPQPYFDNNPFGDTRGKIGPTYVRPKDEINKRRGIWVPTGPSKWEGGCKDGTFSKFPIHMPTPYVPLADIFKSRKQKPGSKFYPQSMANKSLWYFSIVNLHTDKTINSTNYKKFEPTYIEHLVN